MKLRRLIAPAAAAVVLFALATPTHAQDATTVVVIASVSDDAYPNARIVLNVEERSAEALPPLDGANFTVEAGGSPANVVSANLVNSDDAPLDLTIVVDTSGSMAGAPIANAISAARALVDSLPPADRVSIVNFGDEVRLLQDFTTDRALVNAAIDSLTAQGNTALYQATAVGALQAASSAASRRAVILLSDGADFGGKSIATRDESLAAATSAGVPFFTIAQGNDLDRPFLTQLADVTRGRYLEAPRPEDLNDLYLQIGRLLRSQYIVTFDASAVAALPETPIRVTLTAGTRTASSDSIYRPAPDFARDISLSGVTEGDAVSETRELLVTLASKVPGTSVTWYLDGQEVLVSSTEPYIYSYDPTAHGDGEHTLRVSVNGTAAPLEAQVAFTSAPPVAAAGGGPPLVPILCVVAALVGGGIAFYVMRKRRKAAPTSTINPDQRLTPWAKQVSDARRAAAAADPASVAPPTVPEQEDIGEVLGVLISRAGNDVGREYSVGTKPVGIGSAATCGVRVNDPELGMEEARIWVRDDHLMLHRTPRLSMSTNDDVSGSGDWGFLEPGDTFAIGTHVFEFRLIEERSSADGDPVPNILRGGDAPPERPAAGQPQTAHLRLSDLMPKNDGGFIAGTD